MRSAHNKQINRSIASRVDKRAQVEPPTRRLPVVGSITTLLETMRLRAPPSIASAVASLRDLLGCDIKIRTELAQSKPTAEALDNTESSGKDDRVVQRSRILLTAKYGVADMSHPVLRQCNGLVLEYPTWRVLAQPSQMTSPRYKASLMRAAMNDYVIYDISDGTTVTLYWYHVGSSVHDNTLSAGSWRMATANGFETNKYKWLGNVTYMEAFLEAAAASGLDLENLDRTKSHTIGFRHPAHHPLECDPARLWHIQSADLCAGIVSYESIGIYLQTPAVIPVDVSTSGAATLDWLLTRCGSALDRHLSTRGSDMHETCYGYILRYAGTDRDRCDILLESTLLKQIRRHIYNMPKPAKLVKTASVRSASNGFTLSARNRLEYITLRAYLSCVGGEFLDLFPQYTEKFALYDAVIGCMTDLLFIVVRGEPIGDILVAPALAAYARDIIRLCHCFAIHVKKHIGNGKPEQTKAILADFLSQACNIEIYLKVLFCPDLEQAR